MRLRAIVVHAMLPAVIAASINGCSDDATGSRGSGVEKGRPSGVPAAAQWVGGSDGGVFVQLTLASAGPPQEYQVRVFSAAGEVETSGLYRRDPPATTREELISANALSGWDGEKLILTAGGALIPVRAK